MYYLLYNIIIKVERGDLGLPKKVTIDKEAIIDLYIVKRKTLNEVCEELNIKSPITLRKRMDEYGIPRRDPNKENSLLFNLGLTQEELKKELEYLYLEKLMSTNEIAKKYDISATVIRRRFIEYKIPLRDHKESNVVSNSGSKNPKWNGGRMTHSEGYILIRMPEHPNAIGDYVYEHRYIMECHLGRLLNKDEHIHHINEVKNDNRIENLQVVSPTEHAKIHIKETNLKRWSR